MLLQCALNTEQSITVLAESEKYLTLELLTAKLLTLDRTKFVIYQQEDVHLDVLLYKQEFFLLRQTILGTRTEHCAVLMPCMLFLGCDPSSHVFTNFTTSLHTDTA